MTRPFCYMVFHAAEEAVSFFVESLIKPTQAMENLPWNYDMKVPKYIFLIILQVFNRYNLGRALTENKLLR
jgi:hypothetical protein